MIRPDEKAPLIRRAEALARRLGEWRSPHNGDGINPSMVERVRRYLWTRPSYRDLEQYLALFARSRAVALTRAEEPQADQLAAWLRTELGELRGALAAGPNPAPDAHAVTCFAYVLGWTARLLHTRERGGAPGPARGGPPGGGGARGGPGAGGRGGGPADRPWGRR